MSTNLVVPDYIAARIAARAGQKSSMIAAVLSAGFSHPKISTRASRYRLVEDGVETVVGTTLDVVTVGVSKYVSKIWYSKPYDGATDVRPDCWSNDGITPDASIAAPFAANCATCSNNVKGSKITPTGSRGKICADQRHIAVMPAADPTKVYGLTVTVSAMTALREYFKDLDNYGISPSEVVTQLGFDDQASYPKVTFKQNGFVPDKAMSAVDEICRSEEVKLITRQTAGTLQLAAPRQEQAPQAVAVAAPVKETKAAKKAEANTTPAADDMSAMETKLKALFAA